MARTVLGSAPAMKRRVFSETKLLPSASGTGCGSAGSTVSFSPCGWVSLASTGMVTTSLTRTLTSSGLGCGASTTAGAGTGTTETLPVADLVPLDMV